jgi:hypothetical protein
LLILVLFALLLALFALPISVFRSNWRKKRRGSPITTETPHIALNSSNRIAPSSAFQKKMFGQALRKAVGAELRRAIFTSLAGIRLKCALLSIERRSTAASAHRLAQHWRAIVEYEARSTSHSECCLLNFSRFNCSVIST